MTIFLRGSLILGAFFAFFYMLRRIRQSKIKIEHSIFWILFSGALIFMGIFPKVIYKISRWIDFQSPVNLVFLIIIFVLLMKQFLMSIEISQLENKLENIAQFIAVKSKLEEEKGANITEYEKHLEED